MLRNSKKKNQVTYSQKQASEIVASGSLTSLDEYSSNLVWDGVVFLFFSCVALCQIERISSPEVIVVLSPYSKNKKIEINIYMS